MKSKLSKYRAITCSNCNRRVTISLKAHPGIKMAPKSVVAHSKHFYGKCPECLFVHRYPIKTPSSPPRKHKTIHTPTFDIEVSGNVLYPRGAWRVYGDR